jgi:hypothetical protein
MGEQILEGVQFVTNMTGEKTAVLIDLKLHHEIWEEFKAFVARRSSEEAQDLPARQIRKSTAPFNLAWRGALRNLGETQTSVELEHQALEWWKK